MSTTITTLDKVGASSHWFDAAVAGTRGEILAIRPDRYSSALTVGVLALTDACVLIPAFLTSILIWTLVRPTANLIQFASYWPFLLLFIAVYVGAGLYQVVGMNPIQELRRSMAGTTLAFFIFAGSTFLIKDARGFPRSIAVLTWLLVCLALPPARAAVRSICGPRSWFGRSVVILGAGKPGESVVRALQKNPGLGLKPVAVLDDRNSDKTHLHGVPILGGLALAPALAARARLGYGILAMPGLSRVRLLDVLQKCGQAFDKVLVIPDLLGMSSLCVEATDLGGILGLEIRHNLLHLRARIVKRALDLLAVAALAPVLVPLFCVIGCLIKLTSRGPVFFGHTRIGNGSRVFKAWKFRTMVQNADVVLKRHLDAHPALAEEWRLTQKLKNDPRVTPLGRILRRSSLDELPQLINVLLGGMSLVGPRPIVAAEVQKYGEYFVSYCRVKPGITGLWQISGRNNTTYDERVAFDQYYVLNWSVWLDLYILTRTVNTVLTGAGAY
ncbi:MAG TPA: undecaprenyl-phosphate galactose phosphotransferase WbaP [Bryobacteraceae bacterium]|nr:undecaprenyl-phosphate galactose phosphotransferase WbaP [Bryobacteraceae bacterium]